MAKSAQKPVVYLPYVFAVNPLFIWRFWSCQNVTYTTTATSEREARLQLPAVRLVFVARIRVEGMHHA
ncbi:host cell division inhibitor Icd-like protein [Salmonella enterica]|nr:host cell division inhibitor Icd-like protein [Salmonella enterica]EBQ1579668.1 host cell division inhibitor Icd-like protein [Salmonella enterica]